MTYEQGYLDDGKRIIVGMDEAGYGAWAGPVAAAAVCLPLHTDDLAEQLKGVKDSKQMTRRQRESAYETIRDLALGYGIGHATPDEISTLGLSAALSLAFKRAYDACAAALGEMSVEVLMIDGKTTWKDCPYTDACQFEHVPNGDDKSLTIAAASVLAKVWRDEQLRELGKQYPDYGFERHKGYGTQAHRDALRDFGVLHEVHRLNYKPVRERLE